MISEIVYNVKGNNVCITIVNGNVLMENGVLVNNRVNEIYGKCNEIIERIQV